MEKMDSEKELDPYWCHQVIMVCNAQVLVKCNLAKTHSATFGITINGVVVCLMIPVRNAERDKEIDKFIALRMKR